MANTVETLMEVKLSPEEEQKRNLCVHHGEKLYLFCKDDGKLICWYCERSQEHHGHHTFLLEEIAQEYKEKLQEALKRLKAEKQKAEKLEADFEEQITSWKDLIKNESQSVQDYFKKLSGILDSEEQKELQRLKKKESDVLSDLAPTERELVQQSQLLQDLISDLEYRLQGSTIQVMQDVYGTMERSEAFTLKTPTTKSLSKEHRRVFGAPYLREILSVFTGLTEVRCYWAQVTLDHPTDKSNAVISADKTQVTSPQNMIGRLFRRGYEEDYGVLGSPLITSGKHYWEVDVSDKYAWVLGVYGNNCPDSNTMDFVNEGNNYQHVCSQYKPKYGYWVIGLQNHSEYKAFVNLDSSNALSLTLSLKIPPRCVGVFLDYNAGTVSFFNVTDYGFLICKFSSCSFSQEMFPYFNPMKCPGPLKLCSPSS